MPMEKGLKMLADKLEGSFSISLGLFDIQQREILDEIKVTD